MTMKHILSDGVIVEQSIRSNSRSGYTGAALSPTWTLNAAKPFIAACVNPTDVDILFHINAKHRTSLHLGSYADAREAAYVIGLYNKEPIKTIIEVKNNGSITNFPSDLYELPAGLSYKDAISILNLKVKDSKPKIDYTIIPAKNNLFKYFNINAVKEIAKRLGNATDFQSYITDMTIEDFKNNFELDYN